MNVFFAFLLQDKIIKANRTVDTSTQPQARHHERLDLGHKGQPQLHRRHRHRQALRRDKITQKLHESCGGTPLIRFFCSLEIITGNTIFPAGRRCGGVRPRERRQRRRHQPRLPGRRLRRHRGELLRVQGAAGCPQGHVVPPLRVLRVRDVHRRRPTVPEVSGGEH